MDLEDAIEDVRYYLSLQNARASEDLEDAIANVRGVIAAERGPRKLELEEAIADVRFELQGARSSDMQHTAVSYAEPSMEDRAAVYAGALHTLLSLLREIGTAREDRHHDHRPVRRLSDVRVKLFDVVADQISRELYPEETGDLDFVDLPRRRLS